MKISGYGMDLSRLIEQQRSAAGGFAIERPGAPETKPIADGNSFAQLLERIAASDQTADESAEQYASGKSQDLHGTMVAVAKADMNLALLVNVRNKIIEAYREVMRMS
jgi:flagellar hook-basal body complex protein FliE